MFLKCLRICISILISFPLISTLGARMMGDADQKGIRVPSEAPCSSFSQRSEDLDKVDFVKVAGYDFNRGLDLAELLKSFSTTGFQASNLGDAIDVVNQMVRSVDFFSTSPLPSGSFIITPSLSSY